MMPLVFILQMKRFPRLNLDFYLEKKKEKYPLISDFDSDKIRAFLQELAGKNIVTKVQDIFIKDVYCLTNCLDNPEQIKFGSDHSLDDEQLTIELLKRLIQEPRKDKTI